MQLSRSLARRGFQVRHLYSGSIQTPRGALVRKADDPATFEVASIELGESIAKYSFVKRRGQERRYGHLLAAEVDRYDPDVVISANTPLDVQAVLQRMCVLRGRRFVFWLQDVYSFGVERVLQKRLPVVWRPIAWYYRRLEQSMLSRSDHVILITEDFRSALDPQRTRRDSVHVIENWAPIDEVPVRPKDNTWARKHGLHDKLCFLYSGTLGLKHNPNLLLEIALSFRDHPHVRVVVVSEGMGEDYLREKKAEYGLNNLLLFGFQPFEEMPDVLATGDVLIAILEPDAGVFSVPSKVLTYLCAARPLLLAVPLENLSAKIVSRNCAGIVVQPTDADAFVQAALELVRAPDRRAELGRHAHAYAKRTFDIEAITDRFEQVLNMP